MISSERKMVADMATLMERTKALPEIRAELVRLSDRVGALEALKIRFTAIGAAVGGLVSTFGPALFEAARKALT